MAGFRGLIDNWLGLNQVEIDQREFFQKKEAAYPSVRPPKPEGVIDYEAEMEAVKNQTGNWFNRLGEFYDLYTARKDDQAYWAWWNPYTFALRTRAFVFPEGTDPSIAQPRRHYEGHTDDESLGYLGELAKAAELAAKGTEGFYTPYRYGGMRNVTYGTLPLHLLPAFERAYGMRP